MDAVEMKRTLAQIEEADQRLKPLKLRNPQAYKMVTHGPANTEAIQRIGQATQLRLPPSYVQLLSLHDGIDNFYWVDTPLHSTKYILENPHYQEDYELPGLFLFICGPDWISVGFDRQSQGEDGEMEVVECDKGGEHTRWKSLSAFLTGYLARLQGWLGDAQAALEKPKGE
jgi:hypothetical protein